MPEATKAGDGLSCVHSAKGPARFVSGAGEALAQADSPRAK